MTSWPLLFPARLHQRELSPLRETQLRVPQPDHRGHGPRYPWTRTVAGRGTKGRQLSADEVDKVRAELADYHRFAPVSEQIVAVNEAICEARPLNLAATAPPAATGDEIGALRADRGGVRRRGRTTGRARGRRAGPLGWGLPRWSWRSAPRCRGWVGRCCNSCWPPTPDIVGRGSTVGPGITHSSSVTATKTSTPCWVGLWCAVPTTTARCVSVGSCPATTTSASPVPRCHRGCAAWPRVPGPPTFATAAELLAELAGIRLTAKRIERSAETDGAAAAQRLTAESTAIARRTVAVLPAPSGRREAPDKL